MGIFDTHAHYLKRDFGGDLEEILSRLPQKNVERVLTIACGLDEYEETKDILRRYDYICGAFGVHPEFADTLPVGWEKTLESALKTEKAVALGEIGLDYHYGAETKNVQREVFEKQLILAKKLDLPVIIHSRDACEDTMKLLREYKPRGVMHCFSYSAEIAKEVVKIGMYVGFTGVLTFKNAKKAAEACAVTPIERLLLETDCPYMAPEPHRGERCDSSMIAFTAAKMGGIKGVSADEMIEIANKNGRKLFFGEI